MDSTLFASLNLRTPYFKILTDPVELIDLRLRYAEIFP